MKKNVIIVILVILVLGMGGYLGYDKVFSKDKNAETIEKEEKEEVVEKEDNSVILSIDGSKSLNTKNLEYSIESNPSLNIDVRSYLDENNQRKFFVSYGKEVLEAYNIDSLTDELNSNKEVPYDEDVVDIYVTGFGQAYGRETVFFLKTDGTVEYLPVYYAIKNNDFKIYGKLEGVEKVIKFLTVGAQNSGQGSGWRTALAQRADGTFYDLNELLPEEYYKFY